ncbi:hypothetical protein BKA62DRAFT_700285 [Auriculariales sp. MPI-PUGE-AT-0066]|nr:hypothetical protein BKA62DRAFT_700285 [Auriculariales sp. MPI-PUGE-AT-0066]
MMDIPEPVLFPTRPLEATTILNGVSVAICIPKFFYAEGPEPEIRTAINSVHEVKLLIEVERDELQSRVDGLVDDAEKIRTTLSVAGERKAALRLARRQMFERILSGSVRQAVPDGRELQHQSAPGLIIPPPAAPSQFFDGFEEPPAYAVQP